MDALKALMKDFDPTALMPDLASVLDSLAGIIRLAVMIAPLVLVMRRSIQGALPLNLTGSEKTNMTSVSLTL